MKLRTLLLLIFVLVLMLGFSVSGFGKNTGELKGINNPEMMITDGDSIFVLEGVRVHVFCAETLAPKYSFGKKGSGPGEMTADMQNRLLMRFVGENIFLSNWTKGILYSKKGKMIKEFRFPFMVNQIVPVRNKWVLSCLVPGENGVNAMNVILYDGEFKAIKTLYKKVDIHYRRSRKLDAPNQMIFIEVNKNIYVADQKVNAEIMVFNTDGDPIKSFKIIDKPERLTEQYKQDVYRWFEDGWNGRFKSMAEQMGLSKTQMREMIAFSEYFPTFRNMLMSGDKIFVEMYTKREGRSKYLVFDFEGNLKKETYLADSEPGRVKMMPKVGFTFCQGEYLYLRENIEGETWELFREKI